VLPGSRLLGLILSESVTCKSLQASRNARLCAVVSWRKCSGLLKSTGVSVPAHVQQLFPFPEPLKRAIEKLLTEGAALELGLQQRMDESRAARFRTKSIQDLPHETADLDVRYRAWCAAVAQLVAEVGVSDQARQLIRQAFQDTANRIEGLRRSA
jgi:hypothetical protein